MVLVTVFFTHLVFLCLDIFLRARHYSTDIRGVTLRVAQFVNSVVMIQFYKFVSRVKFTLI